MRKFTLSKVLFFFLIFQNVTCSFANFNKEILNEQKLFLSTLLLSWSDSNNIELNTDSIYNSKCLKDATQNFIKELQKMGAQKTDIEEIYQSIQNDVALDNLNHEKEILLKNVKIFFEDQNNFITIDEINSLIRKSSSMEDVLKNLINILVECGVSSSEIHQLFAFSGYTVPNSSKLDYGIHQYFLGRESLLGSFRSNFKGFKNIGFQYVANNWGVLLGYVATAQLFANLISPVAAIEISDESNCPIPEGPWKHSCKNISIEPYKSSDPNVPVNSCKLTAHCDRIETSIPQGKNEIYYQPVNGLLLDNKNGTLSFQGSSSHLLQEQKPCVAFTGSYEKSCNVEIIPYTSADPNLSNTSFCKMKSACLDISGNKKTENTIYYDHPNAGVAIENCNGITVMHYGNSDGMCFGKSPEAISKVAIELGKLLHVVKHDEL
ncbi:MAG: hypothetical protein Q8S31_05130 [Alphaproteobacteria bacterium]|nr:hypothetical protein [Alphaproteobacteria bacterium]